MECYCVARKKPTAAVSQFVAFKVDPGFFLGRVASLMAKKKASSQGYPLPAPSPLDLPLVLSFPGMS